MFKKFLILAGCCCMALLSWAQNGVIGKTADVRGLVTVSEGNVVRTARNGAFVMDGSRVVTGSNGSVRIRLENNCDIQLKPNQSVIVDDEKDCQALIASIQSLDGSRFAFLPSRDVAGGLLLLIGGAFLLGGSDTASTSTSPGNPVNPGNPNDGGGGVIPILSPE